MPNACLQKHFGDELVQVETGLYRHFNGGVYEVLMTALDTSTRQESVVYRSQKDSAKVYVAPMEWFLGSVAVTKSQEVSRFQRVESKPTRRILVAQHA
jgi:hypothetical protein